MKKYKIRVKLAFIMDLPDNIPVEEITGKVKNQINTGKYMVENTTYKEIKEHPKVCPECGTHKGSVRK